MTSSTWASLEEQLEQIERPTSAFKLCRKPDVRERYLAAQRDFEQAAGRLKQIKGSEQVIDVDTLAAFEKQHKDAKTELTAAQKAYDACTVVLRFTALERKELEKLQNQHPASEEEEEKGEGFAMDTFAPALISAASLDGMPVEKARQYLDTWSTADAGDLWRAAWSIQHQRRTDLGKG
ncbi:hypothetical protein OIE75_40765 (plasmid) [Streptomyces sp. NBC_01723]|uniref:hypothetical protein n=1 Tax=Streptomyces sp. NBC_01723 TaxID=2975921 RepID=UPI002E314DD2|nr:hypothetical protein [Streptomyces sp. NBC_01723]